MTQAPPSLAQHFAGMAAAMGSMAQARARRGEVAHALILAWIAAVLGCLTILAAAWEAWNKNNIPAKWTPQQRRGQKHRRHHDSGTGCAREPAAKGHLRLQHQEHEERVQHEACHDRHDARREHHVYSIVDHPANSRSLVASR